MKNLEKIEQLIGLIDKLYTFANVAPENLLLAKINAKKAYEDALLVANSLSDDLKDVVVNTTDGQTGITAFQVAQEVLDEASTNTEVMAALNSLQKSAKVREGLDGYRQAIAALAAAIPHEDQNIVSLNAPPSEDLYVNSFTKKKEQLVLIVSTNHDAYAVTISDQGTHALTPIKYWTKEQA